MKDHSKGTLLANTFGAMGYLFCFLLWGWTGLLYVPLLFENEHVERFLLPDQSRHIVPPATSSESSPLMVGIALTITAVVLVATIIVFLKAPVAIARTGKTVTTKAANSAIPLLTKGKPIPPAKKRRLTASLIKLAKLLLVLLPVFIGLIGSVVEQPLPFDLAMLVSSVLSLAALGWFCLQYITAYFLRVATTKLV